MKMMRMRILMLNYEYPPLGGGGSNACKYIMKEFAKKNLEVDLVTYSPANTFETEKMGSTFYKKFSARPIHVFGGLGMVLGISGTLLGGYMGMERLLFGVGLSNRLLFLLAVLMVIIGVQFIV